MKITKISNDHQRVELNGHTADIIAAAPNNFNIYGKAETLATIKLNLDAKKIYKHKALSLQSVKDINGITSDVFDALA